MNNKIDINQIHRYLTGECTSQERERVEEWRRSDPANDQFVERMRKIWEIEPRKEVESDVQLAWQRLEKEIANRRSRVKSQNQNLNYLKSKNKNSSASMLLRVAAIIVLSISITLYFVVSDNHEQQTNQVTEVVMKEAVSERAQMTYVTLNDGSKVTLNADSRIRYPEKFDPDVREVYLEGEAYFEIEKSLDVEFIVTTKDAQVKVLGTKFNIKDRGEDTESEVVVSEGRVSVHSNHIETPNSENEVILLQGQMTTIAQGQVPTSPKNIELEHYISWLQNEFVFDREPLSEIFKELERRFDVGFVVKDDLLLNTRFSGSFYNDPIEEIVDLISQSLDFNYDRNDNKYIIHNKYKNE